jgi:hypothetical protein
MTRDWGFPRSPVFAVAGWILALISLIALATNWISYGSANNDLISQIGALEEDLAEAEQVREKYRQEAAGLRADVSRLEISLSNLRADYEELKEETGPPPKSPPEEQTATKTTLDESAVLAMLKKYLSLYNQGGYMAATAFLSSNVGSDCGGPGGLASALSQNHQIEQIDYGVTAVKVWENDPDMADVTTVETYGGRSYKLKLGLAFVFEKGRWKLDDLYPLGAGAFC